MTLKKNKISNKQKAGVDWRIIVEAAGSPGQQEQAVRQAVKYIFTRLAGKKSNTYLEC